MTNLTTQEILTLNNLTRVLGADTELGTKLQAIITALADAAPTSGTPVNAVNASKNLALTGISIDGETVTINNPAVAGTDVYELLADVAQTKTAPGNIAVDITAYVTFASQILTMDTQPTAGDTITIGTKVYTWVPVGTDTADGEISIGADLAEAKLNLVDAINGDDEFNVAHTQVSAAAFVGDTMTVTALIGGTAANSIATTEVFSAGTNVWTGATLAGGGNCSTANTVVALLAAMIAEDTQGVTAAQGAGNSIDLTADVAGVVGNAITLSETLANGNFAGAATALSGGVNGTVSNGIKIMLDGTHIYFTLVANSITGKNWVTHNL